MGLVRPNAHIIAGLVVNGLALLFHVVAVAAPGWFSVRLGEKGGTMVGLWQYCYNQPKFNCQDVSTQWDVGAWLEASRAFAILGFLALLTCTVAGFLLCFLSQVKVVFTLAPMSALIAGFLIFIQMAIFAGEVERRKNSRGQDFHYEYCLALAIVAFLLAQLAALLLYLGKRRTKL